MSGCAQFAAFPTSLAHKTETLGGLGLLHFQLLLLYHHFFRVLKYLFTYSTSQFFFQFPGDSYIAHDHILAFDCFPLQKDVDKFHEAF